jgi:hypothetical protein
LAAWAESRALPCRREEDGQDETGPTSVLPGHQGLDMGEAPGNVMPVPRFHKDVEFLLDLTEPLELPRQLYRAKHALAFFVIGDASGSGKGVAVVEQYGVEYESGSWKLQWMKESFV